MSEVLLRDFYLSENSEIPPDSLKQLAGLSKFTRPASSKILHEMNFAKEKKIFVKFINNKAFVSTTPTAIPLTADMI